MERGLITEESDQHQYRFVDIVDVDTNKPLFQIEHETRSMRHPMFNRTLHQPEPGHEQPQLRAGLRGRGLGAGVERSPIVVAGRAGHDEQMEIAMTIQPYHVSAYNTAKASENKIHDDATARRFGFSGGLVGGVHVYAYMTHLPVARWGRAWLERGTGDCRFGKPVYEGDIAEIAPRKALMGWR